MTISAALRGALIACVVAFASAAGAESMFVQPSAPQAAPFPQSEARGLETNAGDTAPAAPQARGKKQKAAAVPASPYRYYVEFRSRHALSYGHTFMAYGRLTADGRIADQTIIGLHPMGDDATWWSIGHVVWVPSEVGPSDGDLEEEYISARYRIDLTREQYENVVAFAKKLGKESPMWHAVLYNCSAFVGKIATHMGLKSPSSLEYPANFINGMREMNGGRRTISTLAGGYAEAQ